MNYEFGSIQVVSEQMQNILHAIQQCSSNQKFIIVGDSGCGKTTLAEYIKKVVFNNAEASISEIETSEWKELKNKTQISDNTCVIFMPNLNERKADLPALAQFFLQVLSLMNNQPQFKLTEKSLETICQYRWPGNFYEFETVLENAFHSAVKSQSRSLIEPVHLKLNQKKNDADFSVGKKLDEIERKYILQTLYFVQQNRTKAAEILGISIRTLRNKINQYREEGYL